MVGGGVAAQWVASWLRVPSVLILLPLGILAGPVTGIVDPSALFGDALFPVIAIAVGLILFEGGLSLQLSSAKVVGRPVLGLITVGVAITWLAGGFAAVYLFGFPRSVGFLLGAILVVSGPTVVLPLLQTIRLRDPIGPILRWECITIDPIGALLAVAVFEAIVDTESGFNPFATLTGSAAVGITVGVVGGFGLAAILRFHLVPDRLHNPLTLAVVVTCFVVANILSVEAGLFATTIMGVVLANQRLTAVKHIAGFGEDLGVLLLGGLFIVLGATIDFDAMRSVFLPSIGLLGILLVTRPVVVWLCTFGSKVTNAERAYLSLIAPRGVIAASVGALFSVSLQEKGIEGASQLAPAAFCVIIGSVAFASLIARPASVRLRVAAAERQGILLAGNDEWLLDAAGVLAANDVSVLLVNVDGDPEEASSRGVLSYNGPLESEDFIEAIAGVGIGSAVIAVESETSLSFLVERLSELLGRENVYAVAGVDERRPASARAWGRSAFGGRLDGIAHDAERLWDVEVVPLAELEDDVAAVIPLFFLAEGTAPVVAGQKPQREAERAVVLVVS